MKRRSFFGALAALPFLSRLKPEPERGPKWEVAPADDKQIAVELISYEGNNTVLVKNVSGYAIAAGDVVSIVPAKRG